LKSSLNFLEAARPVLFESPSILLGLGTFGPESTSPDCGPCAAEYRLRTKAFA
jgi:hypothetical protein